MSENILQLWPVVPIIIAGLFVPKKILNLVAKFPLTSPNMITIWSFVLHYYALYLIVAEKSIIWGAVLSALSWVLDSVDGRMARSNGTQVLDVFETKPSPSTFFQEIFFHGKTKVGQWIDPLRDKLVIIPTLLICLFLIFGNFENITALLVIWMVMAVAEIVGTVIRPPFSSEQKEWLRCVSASGLGKTKAVLQYIAIGAFYLIISGLINFYEVLEFGVFLLICASLLAWLSVFSKIKFAQISWFKGNTFALTIDNFFNPSV